MSVNVSVTVSSDVVKTLMVAAVILGIGYVIYRSIEGAKDSEIPLPPEAKDFASLPEVTPTSLDQINFHPEVKARATPLFEDGHFVGAVREAAIALYDVIRRRSGLNLDSTELVAAAFRSPRKRLRFVDVAPQHIQNAEDGMLGYLESFSKHARKIHMHSTTPITKDEALLQINLASYLAAQVERHTEIIPFGAAV